MYLPDTNVISELCKGDRCDANVSVWYAGVADDEIHLSALVLGEIRRGVELIRDRGPQQTSVLESWLREITGRYAHRILPVDQRVADAWGRSYYIRNAPVIDGLLAATARVHNLTLVTRNIQHVQGLGATLLNPFESATGA